MSIAELELRLAISDAVTSYHTLIEGNRGEHQELVSFMRKAEEKGHSCVIFTERITPTKAVERYRDEIRNQLGLPFHF